MDADTFRHRMTQLPRPVTDKIAPYWEYWRMVLYDWILANDPMRFWQCPAVYHCMLVNHWPDAIVREMSQLESRFRGVVLMPHFGPDDYYADQQSSMNLIHQAYHIQQWEQATGQRINQLHTIVEFGGGYGAMALLCHRLGFEGKYMIYDLPEFALLQAYYLSQFGLLDKVEWNPVQKPKDVDLFMALYSLSEIPIADRIKAFIEANSYLYLYSGKWQDYDNVYHFQTVIPESQPEKQWQHWEINLLPDKNNWYSIGY